MNMSFQKLSNITSAIGLIILSNALFYLLAYFGGVDRAIIDIDYFIVFIFLFIRNRFLYILSFLLLSFFDFMGIFMQIFPFIRFEDFIYLLKFSLISSFAYQVIAIAILIGIFFQIYFIYKIYKFKLNLSLLFILNFCLIIAFYQAFFLKEMSGSFKFWKPEKQFFIASQGINYVMSRTTLFAKNYEDEGKALNEYKGLRAGDKLIKSIDSNQKMLFIINESWGATYEPQIQAELLNGLLKSDNVIDISLSSFKFDGFTLNGELRELCKKSPLHFNLKDETNGFEECMPHEFKRHGYHTTAVHGALGLMYDREDWYPRAGFETILFRDSGLNLPNSRCYSFPGNCDRDIAQRIIQQFNKHDKLFLYWLTLNTHAIYDIRDLKDDQFDCKVFSITENTQSCRNLKLQKQFFNTLAMLIKSPALKGAKVLIVGDHEPPIIEKEKTIFLPSTVPVLEFDVKH